MNREEEGSVVFESLGTFPRRGVLDLKEIGTDEAKTCIFRETIDRPGTIAKLYE